MPIRRILPIRPGEGLRLLWLAGMGMAFAAATSLGDDIAQSVFVTRVGADELPRMFLFKGLLDVVAAALYLPLTHNRSTPRVWRAAITIYIITIMGARIAVTGGGVVSAYALYITHECAWTILTIHWGVFILDAFDASQARRLFPVLFTAERVGAILAGTLLSGFAQRIGAIDMLFVATGFAGLAGALSLLGHRSGAQASLVGMRARRDAGEDGGPPMGGRDASGSDDASGDASGSASGSASGDGSGSASGNGDATVLLTSQSSMFLWRGWRQAMSSPLVRAIAWSSAAMVLVRYGLRMVSIDRISAAFDHQEDQVASFLGSFTAWANLAGALIGLFVVPRILHRMGVGAANLLYALCTTAALGAMLVAPGLYTAGFARFINMQFKSALKTPLSTLFYGAEPPYMRPLARAFIFGAVIPAATIITSLVFEFAKGEHLVLVAVIALVVSGAFIVSCAVQNHHWRRRMRELLTWKLARAADPDPALYRAARAQLDEYRASVSEADRDDIARALAGLDRRLRAVGEEVLAETIPRRRAHGLARRFVDDGASLS